MRASSVQSFEVLISADSHVNEPPELWERLPAELRALRPVQEPLPDGGGNAARLFDFDLDYPSSHPISE